jgi:alkylation response protein AidB-like acyl-CoA dehydrogenase
MRTGRQQGHLAVHRAQVPAQPDGTLGDRNGIFCGALEHKMGIHGSATCQMVLEGAWARWWASPTRAWRRCS